MKKRRFSDQQLFFLRNHIPIRLVIEKILGIPSKISQGAFRFKCPRCDQFNTAINLPTNLARCFSCEENFNPIDMVMAVKKTSFLEAATLLENYQVASSHDEKQDPEKQPPAPSLLSTASTSHRSNKNPVAIGHIISSLIENGGARLLQNDKSDSPNQNTSTSDRIARLENDIHRLSEQIDQLKSIILQKKLANSHQR